MNTTEKLNKIRARCVELLALAEKRTQGKWEQWKDGTYNVYVGNHTIYAVEESDALFIASCAGAAEAGWRTTIAAIDGLREIYGAAEGFADGAPDASSHARLFNEVSSKAQKTLNAILAAWPDELL